MLMPDHKPQRNPEPRGGSSIQLNYDPQTRNGRGYLKAVGLMPEVGFEALFRTWVRRNGNCRSVTMMRFQMRRLFFVFHVFGKLPSDLDFSRRADDCGDDRCFIRIHSDIPDRPYGVRLGCSHALPVR